MTPVITVGIALAAGVSGFIAFARWLSRQYKPKTRQDIRLECLKMAERNSGTHRPEDIAKDGEYFFDFTLK